MKFDAGRALSFAALLSRPRGCGTPDERWAADRVREAFRDAGLETSEEWFHFRARGDATVRLLLMLSLATLGLLWSGGAWWPPLAGIGAAAGVALACGGRRLATSLLMSGVREARESDRPPADSWSCSNVVGDAPGPASGPLIVFTAHYDSKSQNMPIAVRALLFTLLAPAGLATAILGAARALGADLPLAALHTVAAGTLAAALPLLVLRTGNASPGALDNACGLAVLVELARLWRQLPAARGARARFVATGAEEHGLIGSRVHLRRRLAELRGETRCWILNLDGCATPGALRFQPARGRPSGGISVQDALVAGGATAGCSVRPLRAIGILADHVPFVEAGLSCATLLGYGKGTWRIHTAGDRVDLLEDGAFGTAGRVVLGTVGVLLGAGGGGRKG